MGTNLNDHKTKKKKKNKKRRKKKVKEKKREKNKRFSLLHTDKIIGIKLRIYI
eukprot:NODE_260_length_1304_cov_680.171315_g150_i0.p2 GENE.NODE_260_length_1304_cov_680.171315_g150_i0~~NODE_260_length_1304_cov_680.171315_g150_i0.p2  ORF type:complete len:61 (-),score=18.91 NODE_260_length_1304_cov_680.171315_g150_i0:1121-1279(-)